VGDQAAERHTDADALEPLRTLLRSPTVSRLDDWLVDPAPLDELIKALERLCPRVHRTPIERL
jgi:carboxypeptidase PM20D1